MTAGLSSLENPGTDGAFLLREEPSVRLSSVRPPAEGVRPPPNPLPLHPLRPAQ